MSAELLRGRALCEQGAWSKANEALRAAERATPLAAEDRERLATSAYMLGRLEEYVTEMDRAHRLHLEAGATALAGRCAFWIGMQLLLAGEAGRGTGWIGRSRRLVDEVAGDCVEHGYLRVPLAFKCRMEGAYVEAADIAADAARIAHRFGDEDLFALAAYVQGHMLVRAGRIADGLALLDEAMVTVTSGDVSPIATGMVYCGVILGCQDAFEPGRAREWTATLTTWCDRQPDMVAFTGRCQVHRAELMRLEGSWTAALQVARSAAERSALGNHRAALAEAAYVQGDVHRLRGAFREAEAAYLRAGETGREPQPGLALLRLAQKDTTAAAKAIRRVLAGTADPAQRVQHLPACAEIMIAAGDLEAARAASRELGDLAGRHETGVLRTIAAHARGAVDLAAGDAEAALAALRTAWQAWEELQAPYEAARARELIAAACRRLGDDDAAAIEAAAARRGYERLGAAPDLARLGGASGGAAGGLSPREQEVLRLVAEGLTNRAIAEQLVLSERTVDRHLSNVYAKLGVSSRAAATASAYERGLL